MAKLETEPQPETRSAALEFAFCGFDLTYPRDRLKDLFQMQPAVEIFPSFSLGYQGFPWDPARGYEEGTDPFSCRQYGGASYPAWHEIEALIKAMPSGTKLSFRLNDTEKWKYASWLLQGPDCERGNDILKLIDYLCDKLHAHHIHISISSHGVNPELIMETASSKWIQSAQNVMHLAARYPHSIFWPSVFENDEVCTWPFVQKVFDMSKSCTRDGRPLPNLAGFFDNSRGSGKEPENAPEIPKDYPRGVGQPIGFTGGIGSRNAQEWLSRYKEAATAAGCRCQCDAQSSFRVGKTRTNPIDAAELEKLARVIYEWGGRDGKTPSRGPRHATSALRSRSAHRIVKKSARAEHFLVDLSSPL
ncbi:unnamed protein product, partial [Durusdinium trenchii]